MAGAYNRTMFFDMVRASLFSGGMTQGQVDGMNAQLDYAAFLEWLPTTPESYYFNYWNAYLLATSHHETAFTHQPVEEYGSDSYLNSRRYAPYWGRGHVQMTWEENYRRSDSEIAAGNLIADPSRFDGGVVNQHGHPEQALDMEVSCCNLFIGCWRGWWTGKRLTDYLTNENRDYHNARRIVNGTDKAGQIAGYADAFEAALIASWQDRPVDVPPPTLPPPMPEPPTGLPVAPEGLPDAIEFVFADRTVRYARED